jgi:hypothetical protein
MDAIVSVQRKDLRLVGESPNGGGKQNAIVIPLVLRALAIEAASLRRRIFASLRTQ